MEDIKELIRKTICGDAEAFGKIVCRYQDMAVGYAYSIIGDFHYAQDAAQEAFILAYLNIRKLKESNAFGSWLRRIVFSSCGRITRKKKINTISMESIEEVSMNEDNTFNAVYRKNVQDQIFFTLRSLPKEQYSVIILHYINDYSYKEIADFLDLPITTVNNRIHSAKQKIKKGMFEMFEENIKAIRVSSNNEFRKKVIEGICRIGFQPVENMAPENIPFASIMRLCVEHLGEDYGFEIISEANLRVNNAYTFFMGVSGAAFRFFWNWNPRTDEGGRVDSIFLQDNPTNQISRALEAAGYDYELIFNSSNIGKFIANKDYFKDKSYIQGKIVESIKASNKPVLGLGIVGPTEWSIITGYDEEGEVLIGWSYFQETADKSLEFEPCGYFRKRGWYDDTAGIVIVGEKREKPLPDYIYAKALKYGIEMMGRHDVNSIPTGFNAYIAWSKDILNDEYFPMDNKSILQSRYLVQEVTCLELAERRWYGSKFLEKVMRDFSKAAEELKPAIKCLQEEHDMMWSILELTGGFMNPDAYINFSKRDIRIRISEIILKALDKEREAAECLTKAINKF